MTSVAELGVAQVAVWWIAGAVLVAAWWVTFGGQHRNPRHDRELAWWVWHWFTGGPLETTRSYPGGGGRPRRAVRRAGRAACCTALAAGFVAAIYLRSGAAHGTGLVTVATWGLAGAGVLSGLTVLVALVAVEWSMWRHYVRPLHWAVARSAGWDLDMRWWRVRRYIRIPRGLAEGGDGVVVVCGPTFEPRAEVEKRVVEIVTAKVGLSDVSVSWTREGIHRYVQFRRQEPVPEKVPFRKPDLRELVEATSTSSKVVLGLTRGDKVNDLDLDRESPHVLISAGTGGGKSATLVAITAQLMWHGAEVTVLDYKRHSHLWLRDLPGVRYARDIGEIHRTLIALAAEGDRRNRAWDPVTLDEREAGLGPVFPRHVIVCEEMSSTMGRLRDHWTDVRESKDPPTSPAVRAFGDILNMGRAVKMNVLAVAQRADANSMGNGSMRENFSVRILVDRYQKATWQMLVPECDFVPGISHPGRAQVCTGATATTTQMLWITEREAQRWVIDKRGMQPRREPVAAPVGAVHLGDQGARVAPATTADLGNGVEAVSLREASSDEGRGIVTLSYSSLRAERLRHPNEFPDSIGRRPNGAWLFDPRDLQRWEPNRVRPKQDVSTTSTHGDQENETDSVGLVDDIENDESAEKVPLGGWLQQPARGCDNDRARFWAKVDRGDGTGCELWTGAVNGDGYGYFRVDGRPVPVHRFAYQDRVGPIPEGLTIDHLIGPGEPCMSKLCVRGDHLEAVTNEKNVARRHERDKAQQGVTT